MRLKQMEALIQEGILLVKELFDDDKFHFGNQNLKNRPK